MMSSFKIRKPDPDLLIWLIVTVGTVIVFWLMTTI